MSEQSPQPSDRPTGEQPPESYAAYVPPTVPAGAAAEPLPGSTAPRDRRPWWIVGGAVAAVALWVFGFVGGVAVSQVFDGGHGFDRYGSSGLHVDQPLPPPGGQVPGAPDFDDDAGTG
jgi:hypothetical protein